MIKICTHLRKSNDLSKEHWACEWCSNDENAHYWTQAENGYKPASSVVFHCQAHRQDAREKISLEIAS